MSPRVREVVFLAAAPGFALALLWGLGGLPEYGRYRGPYGDVVNAVTVPERHLTNAVTAVNFDVRGFDTLGEEAILFAAVAGIAMLLRERRGETGREPSVGDPRRKRPRSDAVRWMGVGLIGVVNLFGIYVVLHAHQTPGGGFQGGALLGTGSLLAYLAGEYAPYRRVTPKLLIELAEALGVGGFALVGLATLLAGGAFLENLLPLGRPGALMSAGTIPLLNLLVGLAVAAGFALLFVEFLEETRAE